MTRKLALIQTNGVFIVSDDGAISQSLGLGETPWHLVATTAVELEIRIAQMNKLIDDAEARTADVFEQQPGDASALVADGVLISYTGNGNGGTKVHLNLPGAGSPAGSADIDTLGLKYQQVWRVRKAGVSTVGQLVGYSEEELLGLPGVGKGLVRALVAALDAKGYRLKEIVSAH